MKSRERIRVALIRNVQESRSLSMPLYADHLGNALSKYCDVVDVYLKPDLAYNLAGMIDFRVQDYVGRFWSFPMQLRDVKADIFHIVDHANTHLLRSLDPTRTVVTCHDLMLLKVAAGEVSWNGSRPKLATKAFRWSVNHLLDAGAVLCVSDSTRKDVMTMLGCDSNRVHVVHNGLYEECRQIFDRELLDKTRARMDFDWRFTILHVGKNTFYKNVEGIIKALSLLPMTLADRVHFVKVGLDFTSKQKALIHSLDLDDRVHYRGQVDIQELVLLYNMADVFLFPSLYEGFGLPPLEAMACGTPVVCSDRGSLKEVVGDAVVIVDPEDPKSIAKGVELVLTDSELRDELIKRGLDRAKQFSWQQTAERVFEVYQEILGIQAESKIAHV